jgi:hypothetical protein
VSCAKAERLLLHELLEGFAFVVRAGGQHDHALRRVVLGERLEVRQGGAARAAPGGPEVEHDHLAAQVRELLLRAVHVEHREVRRRPSGGQRLHRCFARARRRLGPRIGRSRVSGGQVPVEQRARLRQQRRRPLVQRIGIAREEVQRTCEAVRAVDDDARGQRRRHASAAQATEEAPLLVLDPFV